jgi:hypothetical protein
MESGLQITDHSPRTHADQRRELEGCGTVLRADGLWDFK